jgi:hypothetical protein
MKKEWMTDSTNKERVENLEYAYKREDDLQYAGRNRRHEERAIVYSMHEEGINYLQYAFKKRR